jgi:chemotaxis methyl-accepting protein methylase
MGHYGIQAEPHKLAFAWRQAGPALEALGLGAPEALLAALAQPEGEAWLALLPHVTTRETYFLRERAPLEAFLARVLEGGARPRLLSAGCASGEEAYTMRLLAHQAGAAPELLGVDVDPQAIALAEAARFGPHAFRGVPEGFREAYFSPEGPRRWALGPEGREGVRFERANLLHVGAALAGRRFEGIACRNVLIYFDRETQLAVLAQLRELLAPGGYLLLGHAELFLDADLGLEVQRGPLATLYRRG